MPKRYFTLLGILVAGLALAFAFLWAGAATLGLARLQGDQRFVRTDGYDTGNNCDAASTRKMQKTYLAGIGAATISFGLKQGYRMFE